MLAARANEGETELKLEEIDRPAPGPGELLIKVAAAGLAPGVLTQWERGMYPILPRTLGNEAAGTVAEIGPGVSDLEVGQRVRMHPNLSCRHCEYCLTDREQLCAAGSIIGQGLYGPQAMPLYSRYHNGALAEYVLVPAWAAEPLPDGVSFEVAAKVHDIADALRALKTAAPPPAATVVLTAATGTIGTSVVRLAPWFGISRVIAVARSRERLEQIKALDPELVDVVAFEDLSPDWPEKQGLTGALRGLCPEGVDVILDFLPEGPGTWQSIASLKTGGTAVLMGANPMPPPLPTVAIMVNAWRILGTRNCTREDARQIVSWLESGQLKADDLITHTFGLEQIASATKAVRERPEPTWMVVVHP